MEYDQEPEWEEFETMEELDEWYEEEYEEEYYAEEEFEEAGIQVKLKPIPAGILKVYDTVKLLARP